MLPTVIYFPDGRSVCLRVERSDRCPYLNCIIWDEDGYEVVHADSVVEAVARYLRAKDVYRKAKSVKVYEEYKIIKDAGVSVASYRVAVELDDGSTMEIKAYVPRDPRPC
jgi:hypothetical protein